MVEEPRDPLFIWKERRLLVDGYRRFLIWSLLGRKYNVIEMSFTDREAAKAWVRASHCNRRNYSAEMKAWVRGTDYLARKKQHGGDRRKASGAKCALAQDCENPRRRIRRGAGNNPS